MLIHVLFYIYNLVKIQLLPPCLKFFIFERWVDYEDLYNLTNDELYLFFILDQREWIVTKNWFTENFQEAALQKHVVLIDFLLMSQTNKNSLSYIFTQSGLQALGEKIITMQRFWQIPINERSSLQIILSENGLAAIKENLISLEEFLALRNCDRQLMGYLFEPRARHLLKENIIDIDTYLSLPPVIRTRFLRQSIENYPEVKKNTLIFLQASRQDSNNLVNLPEELKAKIVKLTEPYKIENSKITYNYFKGFFTPINNGNLPNVEIDLQNASGAEEENHNFLEFQ